VTESTVNGSAAASLTMAVLLALASTSACRPLAAEGESCASTPCAYGLVCFEQLCIVPSVPDAGPPPCETASDCAVDGNDDGRACFDGACGWAGCSFDVDCGTRVCDRSQCIERETCEDSGECGSGQVCEDGACRSACIAASDCGGGLSVCAADGTCQDQCFFDLMCFGDLCIDGVCEAPECSEDAECARPEGSFFCNGGRCESFLPCSDDAGCFDANFRCNDAGRCEERPICSVDAECGLEAVCIDTHCRDTTSCDLTSDCADDEECLAGRCVNEPTCRSSADCTMGRVCSGAACREPIETDVTALVVGTAHGACRADGTGPCDLVLIVGEQTTVRVVGLADDGAPSFEALTAAAPAGTSATVGAAGVVTLTANAAGSGALSVEVTGTTVTHAALSVTVVAAPSAAELTVLVIDAATGAALQGATATFSGAQATSGASGLASLGTPATYEGMLTVEHSGGGVALLGIDGPGTLRIALVLPPTAAPAPTAAGFTATVTSTGDETGEVGIGLALPSVATPGAASLASLFGDVVSGSLEVPLLGGLPIDLPAAVTFEATLPLQGNSVVKDRAYAATTSGPVSVTAFEGRQGQGAAFQYLGGGDPVGIALDFAAAAEGFDVLWQQLAVIEALPLIADGDLADGVADYDGDGDTTELVPDWGQLPTTDVRPSQLPTERVGVTLSGLPAGARGRAFAVAGHWLPGWGFAPTGIGVAELNGDDVLLQLKVHGPANDALAVSPRAVIVEALFEDGRTSRVRVDAATFGSSLAAGQLLTPSTDAFFVDGLPAPGERTLFLPAIAGSDATTYRVRMIGGATRWDLVVSTGAGGGRTVVIPTELGGVGAILLDVTLLRLEGADAAAATIAPFVTGSGPNPPLLDAAQAVATAPAF